MPSQSLETHPLISLCTVTYNRQALLPLLQNCILAQDYPLDKMQWVIVDDSDNGCPDFVADPRINVRYERLSHKLPLGQKRNYSHQCCDGEIIVYFDDDDYYPSTRVSHAVNRLQAGDALIAGSTLLPILFLPERELWMAGPYGQWHATAGTFAFRKSLLALTSYPDEICTAEEKPFLNGYSVPLIQLDAAQTILCIAHHANTYDKRQMRGQSGPFRHLDGADLSHLSELMDAYEAVLAPVNS